MSLPRPSWPARLPTAGVLPLALAILVVTGCPRPLARGEGEASRVAPDSVAVLRLPTVERAERAARAYLAGTSAAGTRSELEVMLRYAVEGRVAGTALLGLDRKRPLLVSWRPSGEAIVWLPVDDGALFSVALDRLLEARGAARGPDVLGGVRVYKEADGSVSMLARVVGGGALLWPSPVDTLGAAALLDAMAAGRLQGRWPLGDPPPPSSSAAAELVATGAGLTQLSPSLPALFGGRGAIKSARAALGVDGGVLQLDVKLALNDAARARVAAQTRGASEPPPGFCVLQREALAVARAPVSLLVSDENSERRLGAPGVGDADAPGTTAPGAKGGPLEELSGQLAVAILPSKDGGPPGWIALGRPAGLTGRDELLESVRAAGVVERRREAVGGRQALVFAREGDPEQSAFVVIADEDLFALAFDAGDAVARLGTEASGCQERRPGAAVYVLMKPRALAAALGDDASGGAPAPLGAADPVAALRRLTARLPAGFSRLEASASLDDDGVAFTARAELGDGAD